MGYHKQLAIEEAEQGWAFVDADRSVCARCFADYAIEAFIRDNASGRECSYCGHRSRKPSTAPMNDVLELIGIGLHSEYADPAEGNPSDEGEYVFPTMDTRELFESIGPIARSEEVHEEIVQAFGDRAWNEKDLPGVSTSLRHPLPVGGHHV